MLSFSNPTRIRIINKLLIKVRIQPSVNCMMQKSVLDACFVYISRFWVRDIKGFVRRMFILFRYQISIELYDVIHQVALEYLNIFSVTFITFKLFPSFKEIIKRYDIIVSMIEPIKSPPPTEFARCFGKD